MNDKNLHRFSSDPGDYPAPDIPADAAWSEMDQLLNISPAGQAPAKAAASKSSSFLLRSGVKLLTITGAAGIVAVSAILLVNKYSNTGNPSSADLIIQTDSQTNRTQLADSTLIIADEQSRISVLSGHPSATVIENGAAFFQTRDSSHLNIRSGSVTITGSSAQVYIANDSAHATTSVFVVSGTVNISDGKKITAAHAGSAYRFDGNSMQLNATSPPDPNIVSYATLIFEFDATPLADVIPFLEKAYGIRIELKSPVIRNCRISAKFENMPLRSILDVMAYTIGFDYKLDDINKVVVLDGENECK